LSVADAATPVRGPEGVRATYRAKSKPDSLPLPAGVVRAYQQAYAYLMIALRASLAPSQVVEGTRTMAEITRLFAPRALVSPMVADYWHKRTVALSLASELAYVEERLATSPGAPGPTGSMSRLRAYVRRWGLSRALRRAHDELRELEHAIGFVDSPGPRRP